MKATTVYSFDNWDENAVHEAEGVAKMSRATVHKTYTGDFAGKGVLEYTMLYVEETLAHYVGFERMTGCIAEKEGSFAVKDIGCYETGVAKGTLEIVPGSGKEGLSGIGGTGIYDLAESGEKYTIHWTLHWQD